MEVAQYSSFLERERSNRFYPNLFHLVKRCLILFTNMEGYKIQKCPGGETGRHIGLKIRRLPEKGRAGSIPAPGTNIRFISSQILSKPACLIAERVFCCLTSYCIP
jgi:hypothetical protein